MRNTMIRSAVGFIATIAVFGLVNAARAATTEGSLTGMSGTTLPAVLTVQSGVTSYTVNVTASTTLVRKFNGVSTLEEFAIGDLVSVVGTVTGTTIDATRIKDLSIQRKGGLFWGTVVSVDPTTSSFVLHLKDRKRVDDQTVVTTSKTKIFQGNREGEFGDLVPGMTVKVIGLWRKSQDKVTADRILIKLTEVNGTVATIDCTANTMTVTAEKKHGTTPTWAVTMTAKTVIRDKNLALMNCADVKVGHRVSLRGLATGTLAMNALQVWDRGAKRTVREAEGRIASIDADAKSFTIAPKFKGKVMKSQSDLSEVTVVTTAETIIVNDDGKAITFADLVVGHKVHVKGTLNDTTLTANLIEDSSLQSES